MASRRAASGVVALLLAAAGPAAGCGNAAAPAKLGEVVVIAQPCPGSTGTVSAVAKVRVDISQPNHGVVTERLSHPFRKVVWLRPGKYRLSGPNLSPQEVYARAGKTATIHLGSTCG